MAGFSGTRDELGATSTVGSELKMCWKPGEGTIQAKESKSRFLQRARSCPIHLGWSQAILIPFCPVTENHLPPRKAELLTRCHISHPLQAQKGLPQAAMMTWDIIKYVVEAESHNPLQSNAHKVSLHLWDKGSHFYSRHKTPSILSTRAVLVHTCRFHHCQQTRQRPRTSFPPPPPARHWVWLLPNY